jgi:hypothetical protein
MTRDEQRGLDDHIKTIQILVAHHGAGLVLCGMTKNGHMDTVQLVASQLFTPDSWRGKSRSEIEAQANALYDRIKAYSPSNPISPERLRIAGVILLDCALTCREQVRPPPPRLTLSPLPAQPRPV